MSENSTYAPLFSQVSLSTTSEESSASTEARVTTRFTTLQTLNGERTRTRTTWSSASHELPKLIVGDVLIGSSVTFCVAPFVAMVDQAIVQRSAGTHTILASVQSTMGHMLRHPATYFRSTPFLWMWALYASTYSTANTLKTMQEHLHGNDTKAGKAAPSSAVICTSPASPAYSTMLFEESKEGNRTRRSADPSLSWVSGAASNLLASSFGLLLGTSAVNMTMSLLKDRAYARMFGNQQTSLNSSKTPAVPKLSYALWMTRDFMVVGSSFLLPDVVVKSLLVNGCIDHTNTSTTLRGAQFLIPIASQIVAGPIHLLGLNVYQQPGLGPLERWRSFQNGALTSVVGARMARILPGYSIGGVGNTYLRDQWRLWIRSA